MKKVNRRQPRKGSLRNKLFKEAIKRERAEKKAVKKKLYQSTKSENGKRGKFQKKAVGVDPEQRVKAVASAIKALNTMKTAHYTIAYKGLKDVERRVLDNVLQSINKVSMRLMNDPSNQK